VRRYAPDTPEQLERLIQQLLSKDPADRFPNTQVLARHLQAMFKALSRPAADDFALAEEEPDGNGAEGGLNQSLVTARTRDEGAEDRAAVEQRAAAGSAPRGATEARASTQDAATLAADEMPAASERGTRRPSATLSGQSPAQEAAEAEQPSLVRPSRFTTIEEEDAARELAQRRSWIVAAAQLLGIAVILALAVPVVMHLTRPATADEVYARIKSHVESKEGASLAAVESDVAEFLARFPDDPRAAEMRNYEHELELDRAERRLQLAALRGDAGDSLLPVERQYLKAVETAEDSPEEAVKKLDSLVALYGAPLQNTNDAGERATDQRERQRFSVELAKRRAVALRDQMVQRVIREIEDLRERMAAAAQIGENDPGKAAPMYRAVIELYGDKDWAKEMVTEARRRLDAMQHGSHEE
jgi:hypothetical protein